MKVSQEHVGKKGKCPKCGTVNLIEEDLPVAELIDPSAELPVAQPIQQAPSQQPRRSSKKLYDPFSPISSADFKSGALPSRPANRPGERVVHNNSGKTEKTETDTLGIISVVAGSLSLLFLLGCFVGAFFSLICSVTGLILAFKAKPPLRTIGMSLNGVGLAISALMTIFFVIVLMMALLSPNKRGFNNPGFNNPRFNNPRFNNPGFNEPGFNEPGFNEPGFNGPGFNGPGFNNGGFDDPNFNN